MNNYAKVKASTQDHLDVEDIIENLVFLKTGWVALVMSTTAVNFDLLSEAEQDATIYAYGAFLNSLSFPIEVLVVSNKADITAYFNQIEDAERNQPNPDLKSQIGQYKEFLQATVQQKTVLDKKFYIIVTFSPLELGMKGLGKKTTDQKTKMQLLTAAKNALSPKRDHVIAQTARLGLNTRQLSTQELVELFYDIYNPAPTGTQRVLLDTASYSTPIVQPSVEVPTTQETVSQVEKALPSVLREEQVIASSPHIAPATISVGENLRPVPPASQGQVGQTASQAQAEALRKLQATTQEVRQMVDGSGGVNQVPGVAASPDLKTKGGV